MGRIGKPVSNPVRTHHCKDKPLLNHWHLLGRSIRALESEPGDLPKKKSLSGVMESDGDDGKVPTTIDLWRDFIFY